jgi:Rhs element Vgr protein
MPVSPRLDSEGVLRISVKSNGRPMAEAHALVSVEVQRAVNRVPSARLVFADGDMPTGDWPAADDASLRPGASISIAAGYGDEQRIVFKGIVVGLGVRIDADNASRLVVECRHEAVRMTLGRSTERHVRRSDDAIIRELVQACGLEAEVDATGRTHEVLTQYDCSDWDFAVARAAANGLLVIAGDERVAVQAPRTSDAAVLGVAWGEDLLSFSADLDALSQLAEVRAVAWSPARQSSIEGAPAMPQALSGQGNLDAATLAAALGSAPGRLHTSLALDEAELGAWAKARQLEAGLARIRGRMSFQGSAEARVGALIEVRGVGACFNGKVFVTAVEHEMVDGNWITAVEFGLAPQALGAPAEPDAASAPGRLPGVEGLQIGVVTQIDGDPAGEQRIQVSLPVPPAAQNKVWVRHAQLQASAGFGALFMPEVGDEVVVGFLDREPSHPVVLGSLYSSARKPPHALERSNDIKALVTRCGHRLEFDDGRQSITVSTPARNKLVLSDGGKSVLLQDQHGNRVQLDAGGITIDTPGNLRLSAKGGVSIDAVGAVDIRSAVDLQCTGLNVACQAAVTFSAEGGASAELKAAGQTSVKGAMVLIN